jgi:hypothetical protein
MRRIRFGMIGGGEGVHRAAATLGQEYALAAGVSE